MDQKALTGSHTDHFSDFYLLTLNFDLCPGTLELDLHNMSDILKSFGSRSRVKLDDDKMKSVTDTDDAADHFLAVCRVLRPKLVFKTLNDAFWLH